MNRASIDAWKQRGQGHLFDYWDDRGEDRQRRLLEDLQDLDPGLVDFLRGNLEVSTPAPKNLEQSPYPPERSWRMNTEAHAAGEDLLAAGKVGYLTAAGGQGSRLGYDGPKGCFPISPLRKASLFQILAEKILAARRRYARPAPWYIMGNPSNLEEMRSYFRRHQYFGLPAGEVAFFAQGTFPTLSAGGGLLLASDGGLFKNPTGHGGALQALHDSGLLAAIEEAGIEELCYTQVDNPLVRLPDAPFLGLHRLRSSEMSSKVIAKAYPEEKLGVVGFVGGRPGVIEYLDLDDERRHARGSDGKLRFSHGSIAIHILKVSFLRRLGFQLPLHQALKGIQTWVPRPGGGEIQEREAVKFERFIFDAIPEASNPLFFETDRAEEFAPLKNLTGVDSIVTCREGMLRQHARWLEEIGVQLPRRGGELAVVVEISPLYASDPLELKKRLGNSVNRIDEDTLLA